jgi:hypothetical protein
MSDNNQCSEITLILQSREEYQEEGASTYVSRSCIQSQVVAQIFLPAANIQPEEEPQCLEIKSEWISIAYDPINKIYEGCFSTTK